MSNYDCGAFTMPMASVPLLKSQLCRASCWRNLCLRHAIRVRREAIAMSTTGYA
ncbi:MULTISPECIES: hypothetical protein [unclassified Nostoc]|uniref:hypothetical protein n=1 Tax=unclassified Nostoc TaxID=2593658 RepID=UPI002AD2D5B5|nr:MULTISPECIES: hypothetical protein [unclassified Nostoc]MDZ8121360.1 hypothetical protein [Nostoc sp. CmiVER01]MDZ8228051.1 hypothetical protein [Nostoc sp. ChiVER01]